MKLYYMETMNPRKVCATAKYLGSPVEYVPIEAVPGGLKGAEYRAINPNGRAPVLTDGDLRLWESAAIMMYLAIQAKSDLWPVSDPARQVEIVRWISWDLCEFAQHTGTLYFENYIKPKFGFGPSDAAAVAASREPLKQAARLLDAHLGQQPFIAGERLSIADFCLGVLLPQQDEIGLQLREFRHLQRWHGQLMEIDAWRNPWPETAKSA
jgi:glutathione S-transferase